MFQNVANSLSTERADYVVESKKSRDVVPKTILGGSTLAMYTHFPSKLLNDVTFGRCKMLLKMLFSLLI